MLIWWQAFKKRKIDRLLNYCSMIHAENNVKHYLCKVKNICIWFLKWPIMIIIHVCLAVVEKMNHIYHT